MQTPAAHEVQVDLPANDTNPAPQLVQTDAPAKLNVDIGHIPVAAVSDVELQKLPAGHACGCDISDDGQTDPAGQACGEPDC